MTSEILSLMETRRRHKLTDMKKYRETNAVIRRRIGESKEIWLSEKFREIEDLQRKYDSFNVHTKVKEFSDQYRKNTTAILRDENNDIIVDTEIKFYKWKAYVKTIPNQ